MINTLPPFHDRYHCGELHTRSSCHVALIAKDALLLTVRLIQDNVTDESHVFPNASQTVVRRTKRIELAHSRQAPARFLGRRTSTTLRGLARAQCLGWSQGARIDARLFVPLVC